MAATYVVLFAIGLMLSSAEASQPSFLNRHQVVDRPLTTRNPALYRLPTSTIPNRYMVILTIDPDQPSSFNGEVTIDIVAKESTNRIVLHAHTDMVVSDVEVNCPPDTANLTTGVSKSESDDHFLTITLNKNITVGEQCKVSMKFIGQYGKYMEGIYLSSYKNDDGSIVNLATTQFQAVAAREAFPCYDEPHLKANFSINIYHPSKFNAISNMDVHPSPESIPPAPANFEKTQFLDTPYMSTYLIAFIVSDFVYVNQTVKDHDFRVFGRRNAEDQLNFGLDFSHRSLFDLEEYTGVPYRLSKLDKAAIPDFSAGAMENWGLVTYREEYLLHKAGVTPTIDEQFIAAVISHENAHMWFGNEVTPMWWDYLWLSEGFATYFEYYTTDSALDFKFRMMDQFVVTYLQTVMRSDATSSTNPMSNTVGSPDEIDSNFNGIAYDKSGSVIRMIQHALGQEKFQKGLKDYLATLIAGSKITEPKLLFDHLNAHKDLLPSDITVNAVFESWSSQSGFPLVSAFHKADRKEIELYQVRYYQNSDITSPEKWYIPLQYTTKQYKDFDTNKASGWMKPSDTQNVITMEQESDWFILNKQHMGYFRVNYDRENWIALSEALKATNFDGIHYLNRAQLIDDSYALATSLRLSFNLTMDLLSYLEEEVDFIPWITGRRVLLNLNTLLAASEYYHSYRYFMTMMSSKSYNMLGFDPKESDTVIDKLHRVNAVSLQCAASSSAVTAMANRKIAQALENPNYVFDPDMKTLIYCCGLHFSSVAEWDYVLQKYTEETRASGKNPILTALGCTRQPEMAERYMYMSIAETSKLADEDRMRAVESLFYGSREGIGYAMYFLLDNFKEFQNKTSMYGGGVRVINAMANTITSAKHISMFWDFRYTYNSTFSNSENNAITRAIDIIGERNSWLNRALREIDPWLQEYGPINSGTLANVSRSMIAICVMIFMYQFM